MFLVFLVAGLVIDGGTAFLNRRDGQNSADVSAMAGTKQLADYYLKKAPLDVYNSVATSAAANGCTASCRWTASYVGSRTKKKGGSFEDLGPVRAGDGAPPPGALGVRVDVTRRPHTYFLGVIGQSTWTIDTTATAISGRPTSAPAGQLLPIAVWQLAELKTGTIYAFTNGKDVPGTFGWLSWSGSKSLADSICTPNNPAFMLPATFSSDPGTSNSSSVRDCLKKWVESKETVLIPIVDQENGNDQNNQNGQNDQDTTYRIVAIAAFTITSFSGPTVDQINGRFEGTLPYSQGATAPGGVSQPPSANSAFYYIGLAQ
jgi:Flp pilus assembly protein TadG